MDTTAMIDVDLNLRRVIESITQRVTVIQNSKKFVELSAYRPKPLTYIVLSLGSIESNLVELRRLSLEENNYYNQLSLNWELESHFFLLDAYLHDFRLNVDDVGAILDYSLALSSVIEKSLELTEYYLVFQNLAAFSHKVKHANRLTGVKLFDSVNLKVSDFIRETVRDTFFGLRKPNIRIQVKKDVFIDLKYGNMLVEKHLIDIQVMVYLSTEDDALIDSFQQKFDVFLNEYQFTYKEEYIPIRGSWFKRMVLNFKLSFSKEKVNQKLDEIEFGIKQVTLEKHQAENDSTRAMATAQIIASLQDIPEAAIEIGSILIIKTNIDGVPKIITKHLTAEQVMILSKNSELLTHPNLILARIGLSQSLPDARE